MPLYDYRCQECGYDFEIKQSFHDDPITDCPNCLAEQSVVRVIGPAGVVFKGSGFYINDSRGSRSNLTGNGHGSDNGNGNGHSENGNGAKSESKSTKETASSTTSE